MHPPNQHSRISLAELKAQIVRKLGPEGSKQYFHYLQRFLSLKLNKVEFDKLCVRILGRENLLLHNQFIRSILRNACSAKSPPPPASYKDGEGIQSDGHQQNGSHINTTPQALTSPSLSNGGDILPVSPRKTRTGFRDRRRSVLGPNGKTSSDPQLNELNVVLENGGLKSKQLDIGRPDGSAPVHRKDQNDLLVRNDSEGGSIRSPLRAPLGVPFCPVSIGGARRAVPPASNSRFVRTLMDNALLDSLTLREQVEQIAVSQGLEGLSLECANVLNHGLDSYIKGLVRSCVELVGARSRRGLLPENSAHKHENHMKLTNGVKPGHQYQIQNTGAHLEAPEPKIEHPISLQDFKVAMELNPRQLGEDWPLLLEKICTRAFEEFPVE